MDKRVMSQKYQQDKRPRKPVAWRKGKQARPKDAMSLGKGEPDRTDVRQGPWRNDPCGCGSGRKRKQCCGSSRREGRGLGGGRVPKPTTCEDCEGTGVVIFSPDDDVSLRAGLAPGESYSERCRSCGGSGVVPRD